MPDPVAGPAPGLRAVLFDFDGTLGDSYPAIAASVNHVRALRGLTPLPVEEVRRHVGRGAPYLLAHTVGVGDADVAAYKAHHPSVLLTGTTLVPGAAEAVAALSGRGLRLGVCSNKPVAFTRALLAHFGLAARFAAVLGPEDVARPKPAPDMLLAALHRLQVTPPQALYVGDMTVDVETARAAGVAVWVVPTGSDTADALRRAGPDRLLRDLHELAVLLASEGGRG
jgi:phosphoglycolate phosphatase